MLDFLNTSFGEEISTNEDLSLMSLLKNFMSGYHLELGPNEIIQSVEAASDFFNMSAPEVQESWATGVITGLSNTTSDDLLFINQGELDDLGITSKSAFDLVMTHEGAHRVLQNTQYTSHQEELCCDHLVGVRAALDDTISNEAFDNVKNSLEKADATDKHPDGELRVQAMDAGYKFAQGYMAMHPNSTPTFDECKADFENQFSHLFTPTMIDTDGMPEPVNGDVTNIPEYDVERNHHVESLASGPSNNDPSFKGFVNDKEWHLKEADYYQKKGDFKSAADHLRSAKICSK